MRNRFLGTRRSESRPEKTFTTEAVASANLSRAPRVIGVAPGVARNAGNIG
ncbi:MAG: hypothetical protein JJE39_17650 [Vicinamibacteria bacterium]|nr:hypothetical protein [Vicinamibacteria bacterium]